jgi:alpha-amylase
MLMSSYAFKDSNQGPPPSPPADACGTDWVCEHRSPAMTSMVAFRQATAGAPVQDWQVIDDTLLSFSRGEKGHVVINAGEKPVAATLATSMAPGQYCNVLEKPVDGGNCDDAAVTVGEDGRMNVSMAPLSAVAILEPAR